MLAITDTHLDWDFSLPIVLFLIVTGVIFLIVALSNQSAFATAWGRSRKPSPGSAGPGTTPAQGKAPSKELTSKENPFKAPQERRTSVRREGNPVNILVTLPEASTEPMTAVIIDRSTGGLCLSVPQPVAAGQLLNVRSTIAPDTTPWIAVEVRHCRQKEDRWLIGCKFQRKLSWSELLFLG